MIVIHDNRGLDAAARAMAQRLADAGFVAVAPDLLSRAGGSAQMKGPAQATAALMRTPLPTFLADLRAAVPFVQHMPGVDGTRISVVALGWGGWRAFMLAADNPALHRLVVYSGATPMDGVERIQTPVLAHYGQFDFRNAASAVWTATRLKSFTYHVYPNAFAVSFDETNRRYDPEATKLAWTRTLEFLQAP